MKERKRLNKCSFADKPGIFASECEWLARKKTNDIDNIASLLVWELPDEDIQSRSYWLKHHNRDIENESSMVISTEDVVVTVQNPFVPKQFLQYDENTNCSEYSFTWDEYRSLTLSYRRALTLIRREIEPSTAGRIDRIQLARVLENVDWQVPAISIFAREDDEVNSKSRACFIELISGLILECKWSKANNIKQTDIIRKLELKGITVKKSWLSSVMQDVENRIMEIHCEGKRK